MARKGETVDLLVDLFFMAMEGRRPELSFPESVREKAIKTMAISSRNCFRGHHRNVFHTFTTWDRGFATCQSRIVQMFRQAHKRDVHRKIRTDLQAWLHLDDFEGRRTTERKSSSNRVS